jgi:hypothetical protein
MLDIFMKKNGYRVEYLNLGAAGKPGAFGFYLRGDLPADAAYSAEAKHHLYAGLDFIQRNLEPKKMVAVYADITRVDAVDRPAYRQLKADVSAGFFRKIFVCKLSDLVESEVGYMDVLALDRMTGGIEIFSMESGALRMKHLDVAMALCVNAYERQYL